MIDFLSAAHVRLGRAFLRALVMLLLASLVVQGTAVQSHVHFEPGARSAPGGQAIHAAGTGTGSDTADCPLCQEAAMAGAYLLPSVIVLPPPPALPAWAVAARLDTFGLRLRAHDWRSRAPPQ